MFSQRRNRFLIVKQLCWIIHNFSFRCFQVRHHILNKLKLKHKTLYITRYCYVHTDSYNSSRMLNTKVQVNIKNTFVFEIFLFFIPFEKITERNTSMPCLLTFSFKIVGCDITVNLPSF